MKPFLPMILSIFLLLSSCRDDDNCPTCDNYQDAYVIGFDPCSGVGDPNGGKLGFGISIPAQMDTVVAYNFPVGIYEFPLEYFSLYLYHPFFPESARYDFPVKLKFRYAKENEKIDRACKADRVIHPIFGSEKKEIIIISITK